MGLVLALMALKENEEAEKRILRMAFKPETQLLGYDLITQLRLQEHNYDLALESTLLASKVSPRNIRRHQQAVELSRITQDHKVQFEQAKNIVKFSKNSIHDTPENYLNVVRAGIDYALTMDKSDSYKLAKQAKDYLQEFENNVKKQDAESQLIVANARLLHLENDKDNALALMQSLEDESWAEQQMEDLLDKAKAFHEVGLHSQSQAILDEIERRCINNNESNAGSHRATQQQAELFLHYLQQEKQQRLTIKDSPRDLNNNAISFYEKGDIERALDAFRQAFTVMPKSPAIALNLLQTLATRANHKGLPKGSHVLIDRCIQTLANSDLNDEQILRYEKLQQFLTVTH